MPTREALASDFKTLQDSITGFLCTLDPELKLHEDLWERDGGGGGRTRILADGDIIEKGGVNFSAVHGNAPDFMKAKDKWFRGIDLNYGPDGAVYIIDWSDTGECHEHDGVHRLSGRVYRIAYGEIKPPSNRDLSKATGDDLLIQAVRLDGWFSRFA